MGQSGMGSESSAITEADRQILEQVMVAARAAEEKKALGVVVLKLSAITEFTDYFVICAGNSTRQTQAIADAVIDELIGICGNPLVRLTGAIAHVDQAGFHRFIYIPAALQINEGIQSDQPVICGRYGLQGGLVLERVQLAVRNIPHRCRGGIGIASGVIGPGGIIMQQGIIA